MRLKLGIQYSLPILDSDTLQKKDQKSKFLAGYQIFLLIAQD